MAFERDSLALVGEALDRLAEGFRGLPEDPAAGVGADVDVPAMREVLLEAATRMHDNFPYHHPLYAGQMLKPPHPVARAAYALSLWLNPNNHALDGGRASSAMEKEVVRDLAAMCGLAEHLGHLTGGGTMANLEALHVNGSERPGRAVLASEHAHYTHARLCAVLGIPFRTVPADRAGRMDAALLERELGTGDVGVVVCTLGTTSIGAVDPLADIARLRDRFGFRLHVDAAYGGYFTLADSLRASTRAHFDALSLADSLAIDPHKHGLQPYGCGCVLFRDPAMGAHYTHDSPYTYFSSPDLHLGEISLECSRPGAAAVALWATHRMLPLARGGDFATGLDLGRRAALDLHTRLAADPRFHVLDPPELDIVVWAARGPTASASSRRARAIFDAAAKIDLHLALARLPRAMWEGRAELAWDEAELTCLRSCLMRPAHASWIDAIFERLSRATDAG